MLFVLLSLAAYHGVMPQFVMTPQDQSAVEGEDVVLHCGANGRDRNGKQPQITWLKDGSTLDLRSAFRKILLSVFMTSFTELNFILLLKIGTFHVFLRILTFSECAKLNHSYMMSLMLFASSTLKFSLVRVSLLHVLANLS